MTTTDTLSTSRAPIAGSQSAAGPAAAASFLKGLWARWKHARKIARDAHLLATLPDHILKDIGLQRYQTTRTEIARLTASFHESPGAKR